MHQGHVSKPVSSDPFPPSHKWYHPNIESDIINEEQYLPLPLVVQMGLGPFDPSFSVQWEGTTQPVQLCPKDLGPVSPLPVCRTHIGGGWGGEGGRLKVKPVLGTLLQSPTWMLTMYTEKTAWQSWAELLPSEWIQAGSLLPAQETTPPHAGDSISWTVVPLIFFFSFLEYLYSFLNL